ncbi:MAG: HdeD family acid-resistance protein [Gemmataceae bacterium]
MIRPMQLGSESDIANAPERLRKVWFVLVAIGLVLMTIGIMAIGSSFTATFATMFVFGVLLLAASAFQIVTALFGRSWRGFFLHLLIGVLYLITGLFLVDSPVEAALGITLLVAAGLLVGGILRIVLSVLHRFNGWPWMLLNGIVSVILGVAIWRRWPLSGLYVIGLYVGIEMLFNGFSWMMLAARLAPETGPIQTGRLEPDVAEPVRQS